MPLFFSQLFSFAPSFAMTNLISLLDNPAIAIWAMILTCFLPIVFTILAKLYGGFQPEDNEHPRQFLANLTNTTGRSGKAARAHAVQQNSYETLPMFLVAVVVAMLFFVPQVTVNALACLYLCLRIIYGIAYIANLATFRSIIWSLSMVCILMLFWLSIRMS